MTDAAHELGRITDLAGLELAGILPALVPGAVLPPTHIIAGNRLRMLPSLRTAPDYEWLRRFPRRERALVRLLAGPMLAAYGYSTTRDPSEGIVR